MRRLALASALFLPCLPLATTAEQPPKPIVIHARRYAFVPAEITLKRGQNALLLLVDDDVPHGLAVPALGIRADMIKGQPVEVSVTPQRTGDFAGNCSRFCGVGHGEMHFIIHVVE